MLYVYDNAIIDDLNESFNPDQIPNPHITIVDPQAALTIHGQIQEDNIQYPLVVLNRSSDMPIDTTRSNFTRLHRGVPSHIDSDTNDLYYEKSIPITLHYGITVLTTNIADRDEIVRELLFKYSDMYFLTIELPYESDRKLRFGIIKDPNSEVEYSSSTVDYLQTGQLYQTIIPLVCEGCVLVTYTPMHLKRTKPIVAVRAQGQPEHVLGNKLY